MKTITGECFCGAVRYEINGKLRDARSCHCSRCRKAFSAQASAYALVDPQDFRWVAGEDRLNTYTGGQGFGLRFCRTCGSTLCGIFQDTIHGVTLGCVNGDPEVEITRHIFTGSKAAWEILPQGINAFDAAPDAPERTWRAEATEVELLYRPMTDDDIADAFSIRLSTDENTVTLEELEQEYGITPASITDALRSHMRGWVCVADSIHTIGFVMGDGSNGEVVVLAVRPAHVGRGIGKHLLGLIEQWLFDTGHDAIWLQSNPDPTTRAYSFYRRLGWRSSGEMRGNEEILIKPREE